MKRFAVVVMLAAALLAPPAPAQADAGHARPRITRLEFVERPLKAGTNERLVVVAHDPDSWISEIQVQWADADHEGGVIFAHTYCVQDPDFSTPGTPAKLTLDVTFDGPGPYTVAARAISEKRCEGGNDTRTSPTVEKDVLVKRVTRTYVDPEDTAGALDVVRASQSQYVDDATLATNIRHTLRFADDLGPTPLTGPEDAVVLRFDTVAGDRRAERILTVDAGADGRLRGVVRNASGAKVGDATATADGARLTVELGRRLLGRGSGRYGWWASTRDASSGPCATTCKDRVPDARLFIHDL